MRTTLIRPPSIITKGQMSLTTSPPLGLAYIASSLMSAGHDVRAIDSVGEDVFNFTLYKDPFLVQGLSNERIISRIDPKTELIGVSMMFSHEWPYCRNLIREIKSAYPHIMIIVGGEHVTAMSELVLNTTPEIDYCILGEGEETTLELVNYLSEVPTNELNGRSPDVIKGIAFRRNGEIVHTGLSSRMREIDHIPLPAWELFPITNYLDNELCMGAFKGRSMPITFTRGCPYQCTFCSNPAMWTQRWIMRDPVLVVEEMRWLKERYQAENFECCDLTAIVRKDWIIKFATLLIEGNLQIAWQFPSGTRSEAIDSEVCELLYQSGCKNLVYAPESGSESVLKRIKKQVHLGRMKHSIKSALKQNINVRVNLVLGFPGDTHREIWQTFRFIYELARIGVHDITHFIFTPYPGSELFESLIKSGKIPELDDDYFVSLLAMTDLKKTLSYTDNISSWQLSFYRISSLIWFYSLMFLFRPSRVFRVLRNIFKEKQESRMETVLKNMIFRKKSIISTS